MAHLITGLIFLPILGALFVGALPRLLARAVALGCSFMTALLAGAMWYHFDASAVGLQMVQRHVWIPAIGAQGLLGADGLSLLLVLLTSLVFPFAFFAGRMSRGFYVLMLVMQAALYGTFTAQNFILWFLFYEMSLIPAFLLIKVWGGEKRDRAATKFFLYTFLGSVAMLLSFLGIYFVRGTFDFAELTALGKGGLLTGNLRWFAFAGIFLGLAVKVLPPELPPVALPPAPPKPPAPPSPVAVMVLVEEPPVAEVSPTLPPKPPAPPVPLPPVALLLPPVSVGLAVMVIDGVEPVPVPEPVFCCCCWR